MSELSLSPTSCPKCGAVLPSSATAGLCPRCLLAEAMVPSQLAVEPVGARPLLTQEELAPHFPQLEILECLGRGGMGVVYKARQKSLNRLVALKLLAPERVNDPGFAERFQKEAQALAKLNHPSIVTVYDFGQAGGYYYLLMEFVDGMNLRQLLNAGRIAPREALAIVPQICDALQYAHDAGIVHRDIKPENILLDRRGRVKVADFGLAKLVGHVESDTDGIAAGTATMSEAGKVVGTPKYMAPEQIEHPATVDHRADIYSLGVVFYQMLTGELPKDDFAPPSKKVVVDVRLDEVVLRALEKRPELRYQQVGDVKTMIETIVATPPGGSRREEAQSNSGNTNEYRVATMVKSERARLAVQESSSAKVKYPTMGEVALYTDRLVISSGYNQRSIPLADIYELGEAVMPFWFTPAPHRYVAVDFDEAGQRRRVVFLAGTSMFRLPGDTHLQALEWLTAIQRTIKSATGRDVLIADMPAVVPVRSAWALIWLSLPLIATIPLLIKLLLPQPGPSNFSWLEAARMIGALMLFPMLILLAVYILRSISLRSTVKKPLGRAASLSILEFRTAIVLGNYAQAWEAAAPMFQRTNNKEEWIALMEKIRRPLGKAVGGKIRSYNVTPDHSRMDQVLEIHFDSLRTAVETMSFAKHPDGEYRVISYDIKLLDVAASSADVPPAKPGVEMPWMKRDWWFRPQPLQTESEKQNTGSKEAETTPRFSRTAIVGAFWAPLFFILILPWFSLNPTPVGQNPEPVYFWQSLLRFALLLLGVAAAPFCTTIFGWVAVSQIRRSAGKLYGLWLAVFDGLLFPLLALDGLIFGACYLGVVLADEELKRSHSEPVLRPLLLLIPIVLIGVAFVDYLIIRRVWRAVSDQVASPPAPAAGKPARGWKIALWCILGVLLFGGVVSLVIGQMTHNAHFAAMEISADFHYRVFEADAALVDRLIPASQRQPGLQPAAKSLVPSSGERTTKTVGSGTNRFIVAKHGSQDTDSQVAVIDLATLHELLEGIAKQPGVLANETRNVTGIWWPKGTTTIWSYSTQKSGLSVHGSGGVNLAYTVENARDKIRIEGPVRHNSNFAEDANDTTAKFLYEGDAPLAHALAFLVPFFRKDNSACYLVVAYEVSPRGNSSNNDALSPVRELRGPPFVAHLNQADVELVAVGDMPWTNAVCWLPNGQMSAEPFPTGHGSCEQWAENMDVKKMAFRIHSRKPDSISAPVFRCDSESGACGASSSWVSPWYSQIVVSPKNTRQVNMSVGIAGGAWETATTLNHENNLSSAVASGEWNATFNAVTGKGGDVAVSFLYNRNDDWESRMAYLNDAGKVVPIQENSSRVGNSQTGATLMVLSNEFAHIKEFQLQRRQYQWVEFRNVSLRPGHRTMVEVKDFGGEKETAPTKPVAVPKLAFGPAIERVITVFSENPAGACLDLGSGQFRVPPAVLSDDLRRIATNDFGAAFSMVTATGDALPTWLQSSGVDLIGGVGSDGHARFKYIGQPPHWETGWTSFDRADPEKVLSMLQASPFYAGDKPNLPAVYVNDINLQLESVKKANFFLFRTHDGDVGIIQVLGENQNQRGVKIRYKLVQSTVTTATPVSLPADAKHIGTPSERRASALSRNGHSALVVTSDTEVKYALFYEGIFNSTLRGSHDLHYRQWNDDGSLELVSNGRTFAWHCESFAPDLLSVNGREFNLPKGRLFVLQEDGMVKQLAVFPTSAEAGDLDALAELTKVAAPNLAFGPVVEKEQPFAEAFDPESGTSWRSPIRPPGRGAEGQIAPGFQFIGKTKPNELALGGWIGFVPQLSSADQWENITNRQAFDTLRNNDANATNGLLIAVAPAQLPQTFLFKTPTGRIGVLQVTGFTENPRGVKIRYKLVQDAKGAATVPSKPASRTPDKQAASISVDPARPFESITSSATALIAKYFSDAQVNASNDEFTASRATQEFQIHSQYKTGDVAPQPYKKTGPSAEGFVLSIRRMDHPYEGQRALIGGLESIREPYWNGYINVGYYPTTKRGVEIYYMFGTRLNKEFHQAMLELISLSGTGSPTASATAAAPNLSFGPVIVRTLPFNESLQDAFLNLDTGRLLTPPPNIAALFKTSYNTRLSWEDKSDPRAIKMREWLRASGANLMAWGGEDAERLEMRGGVAIQPPWTGTKRVGFDETDPIVVAKQAETFLKPLLTNSVIKIFLLQPGSDAKSGQRQDTFQFLTWEGTIGVLQILNTEDNPRGVKIRYKLVEMKPQTVASSAVQVLEEAAVKKVALKLLAAIHDKDDAASRATTCDLIIGYGNNLPVLAKELRRSMEEFTGSTAGLNRIDEVFVDGDFAAVKAASVEKVDGCLVLFFSHTPDGWRNYSLRNAPLNASLRELLAASVKSLNVPLQKRAKAFVDLLAKGQFAGATADFDDAMRTAMPEAKLAELWQQLNSAGGKFLGIGPVVRVEQVPEYFCVYVPCRWERNRVDLKIVFNSAGKLSGLWIVKPADQ